MTDYVWTIEVQFTDDDAQCVHLFDKISDLIATEYPEFSGFLGMRGEPDNR